MRAIVLEDKGGPEVLQFRDGIPDPVPGPEEVLVGVVSSAVNRADLLQRMGLYPGPQMYPEIPGLEFAGRIVAVGKRVTSRQVGDAVMAISGGGSYAELIAIHEGQTMPVPTELKLSEAGAFPEAYITAWDALVRQGGLTAGRWALVHAGASGVGTASIQISRALGATRGQRGSTPTCAASAWAGCRGRRPQPFVRRPAGASAPMPCMP